MNTIYQDWFQLKQAPFAITPDPAFVYLSGSHQEALAHLLYGVGQGGGGGFVQLTGEVGTGKTTLCRCLLEQVDEGTHIALILNPMLNSEELIEAILLELRLDNILAVSHKQRLDRLNEYLLEAHTRGERVVVIIDEAQNLPPETLEQLRLLTNLETNTDKLLQIILLGQPELRDLLARKDLRQLAQRITARFHLTPLNLEETRRYVRHRLAVAGKPGAHNPFTDSAIKALHAASAGVPRLINTIADRALLAAYAGEKTVIDRKLVRAAAAEVTGASPTGSKWAPAAVIVLAVIALIWFFREPPGLSNRPVAIGEGHLEQTEAPGRQSGLQNPPETITEIAKINTLNASERYRASKRAWEGLAATWGLEGQGSLVQESCQSHTRNGIACLRMQGNWNRIRDLKLPVIIELGSSQNPDPLLVTRVLAGQAEVYPLGLLDLATLEQDWRGLYYVAWPQDPDWPTTIRAATAEGEVAIRLKTLATRLVPAWQGDLTALADPQFGSWLRTFQRSWGLEDDGIIGPETLLYLIAPSLQPQTLASNLGTVASGLRQESGTQ